MLTYEEIECNYSVPYYIEIFHNVDVLIYKTLEPLQELQYLYTLQLVRRK